MITKNTYKFSAPKTRELTKEEKNLIESALDVIRKLSPQSIAEDFKKNEKEIDPNIFSYLNAAKEYLDVAYDMLPYEDDNEISIDLSQIRADIIQLIGKIQRYDIECISK